MEEVAFQVDEKPIHTLGVVYGHADGIFGQQHGDNRPTQAHKRQSCEQFDIVGRFDHEYSIHALDCRCSREVHQDIRLFDFATVFDQEDWMQIDHICFLPQLCDLLPDNKILSFHIRFLLRCFFQ